jgi:hypothetical protein
VQVNNGGHDQFYFNSTGIVWLDALKAFRELGQSEVVAIIEASVQWLGGNPSLDTAKMRVRRISKTSFAASLFIGSGRNLAHRQFTRISLVSAN